MIGQWFKKEAKAQPCTSEDVRFLYLLCHGRPPGEEEDISRFVGEPFSQALRMVLAKRETRLALLDRVALGLMPMHLGLDDEVLGTLAAGIRRHFRGTNPRPPYSAIDLLAQAAGSRRFGLAFASRYGDDQLAAFRAGLEAIAAKPAIRLQGGILSLSGLECRGHALNLDTPDAPVMLDFFLNGLYAGTVRADVPEHQFADDFDGHPPFGFSHTITIPEPLRGQDRLMLSVYEKASGMPLVPGRELLANPVAGANLLQALVAELGALREHAGSQEAILAKLTEIEQHLPRLEQYASFPFDQYELFRETFPTAPPHWLATSDIRFDIFILDTGDEASLHTTLASIRRQSYPASSVLTVGGGAATAAQAFIPAARNAEGTHALFLRAGDRLSLHALAWIAGSIEANPSASVFYADYDHYAFGQEGAFDPRFQHAFDYDLLLERNPMGRAFALDREQMMGLGAFDKNAGDAFHQYLLLRFHEAYGERAFHHVPRILWHVEQVPLNVHAMSLRQQDHIRVCTSHFARRGVNAEAVPHLDHYGGAFIDALSVRWPLDPATPRLAIIIPTRDKLNLIRPCVESLQATLAHAEDTEIVILDNGSTDADLMGWLKAVDAAPGTKVIRSEAPFNWSALNNLGAASTDADYLLFLNDDTIALDKGWDTALRRQLARQNVGAVGARLLYRNGTIQHGGMVFYDLAQARHEGIGLACASPTPYERTRLAHGAMAVTGAFLACTRDNYTAVGGFDEDLAVTFNDVDFCFKVRAAGKRVVYEPAITFQHFQSESRGHDKADTEKQARARKEAQLIQARWGERIEDDPYYPKAFARLGQPFSRLAVPRSE